jgi:glucosamine-6-phosphate deaminase
MEVIIKENYDQICEEAAEIILQRWKENENISMGLATGKSPLGLYKRLITLYKNNKMDFSRVVAFGLDEYLGLEENHPQSFAYYMKKNLFQHINIKKENIFRLKGDSKDINSHCREYEKKIKEFGGINIQILGIGRNGHIGFNEPSSSLASRTRVKTLTQETIEANSQTFKNKENIPRHCLTIGIGTIMESEMIILLASGKEKSEAIKLSVEGPVTASIPASILQLHPVVKIIIDKEAASLLTHKDYYQWVYDNKYKVEGFLENSKEKKS